MRPYRQTARAAAVEQTRTRILDSVDEVFWSGAHDGFSLDDIAATAGTTVQTVLRHFGSKAELLGAAAKRGAGRVAAERDELAVGDIDAVVGYLTRHYEDQGDRMLSLIALEHQSPEIASITANGRDLHRRWVQRVLLPLFEPAAAGDRRRCTATLVAVTDLLTWKVLRREQGLSSENYRRCVHDLLTSLVAAHASAATTPATSNGGNHAHTHAHTHAHA